MSGMSKQEVINEMVSEGYDYDYACHLVFGDDESRERYLSAMRQDFPKDFADDDPFTSALLDWSEENA